MSKKREAVQISRIFTGKRTVSVDHVVALANALGVRESAVFAEAERRLAAEAATTSQTCSESE